MWLWPFLQCQFLEIKYYQMNSQEKIEAMWVRTAEYSKLPTLSMYGNYLRRLHLLRGQNSSFPKLCELSKQARRWTESQSLIGSALASFPTPSPTCVCELPRDITRVRVLTHARLCDLTGIKVSIYIWASSLSLPPSLSPALKIRPQSWGNHPSVLTCPIRVRWRSRNFTSSQGPTDISVPLAQGIWPEKLKQELFLSLLHPQVVPGERPMKENPEGSSKCTPPWGAPECRAACWPGHRPCPSTSRWWGGEALPICSHHSCECSVPAF